MGATGLIIVLVGGGFACIIGSEVLRYRNIINRRRDERNAHARLLRELSRYGRHDEG